MSDNAILVNDNKEWGISDNSLCEKKKIDKKIVGNGIFTAIMILIIGSFIITNPPKDNVGWYTLVPTLFAISFIFWSRNVIMAYLLAGLLGTFFMTKSIQFVPEYFNRMFATAMSESYIWLVIVCGMMGSLIVLIEKSGGAMAFSTWISKYLRTKKSSLLATWGLGGMIFVDDYLTVLSVGPSMSFITDKKKVSREMLAYVVHTMGSSMCVLIPISTWAAFVGSVLENNKVVPVGQGIKYFIKTIPFSFYAMSTVLICLLVVLGVIPLFGKMKRAEMRAEQEGILAPPGSEKFAMSTVSETDLPKNPKAYNLFIPLLVLVGTTIALDMEMFMGCVITLIFCFFFFVLQRLMNVQTFIDCIVEGFRNMSFIFVLVALSYSFTATITKLGFANYVVAHATGFMTPQLMPVILFLVFGATEFMTGTNWDLYMLILPIVVPLTQALGCDPYLSVGAVISAGCWGSHVCVASDATVCTASACGCDNYEHATSQMPYAFIAFGLSAIAYLVAGFLIS